MKYSFLFFFILCAYLSMAQMPSGLEVIEKSIQYHDPNNHWPTFNDTLKFHQLNPNGAQQRSRTVVLNRPEQYFKFRQKSDGNIIEHLYSNGTGKSYINGTQNYSKEDSAKYRMSQGRASMYRDYYSYLYGLPMKLKDQGTIIHPQVKKTTFFNQECYVVRASYEEEVGSDIWDFFFDPETFALIAYRFYHDESKNDGEYIRLFDEEIISGIKIPKNRFWYYNKNDQFLGADYLLPSYNKTEAKFGIEQYKNAMAYDWRNLNNKKIFNLRPQTHWFEDHSAIWYVLNDSEGPNYYQMEFNELEQKPLFNEDAILNSLNKHHSDSLRVSSLKFSNLEAYSDSIKFNFKGKRYAWNQKTKRLSLRKRTPDSDPFSSLSPDGKLKAFSKNGNLLIKLIEEDSVIQLSDDGNEQFSYASYYGWYDKMKGENGKRPDRFFVSWSSDNKYLTGQIVDTRSANKMYMLDFSVDSLFRPELYSYFRGSPGDTTMIHNIPFMYDLENKKWINLELPRATHINAINIRWSEKKDHCFISIPKRGFQEQKLIYYDLANEEKHLLIHEKSATNIDDFMFTEMGDYVLYTSQKSGWRQIYKVSLDDFREERITNGAFFMNDIVHIDEEKEQIYFLASGTSETPIPYHQMLYRINLDGSDMTIITPEKRHHEIRFSPDGKYFIDLASSIAHPTECYLRDASDGKILSTISKANVDQILQEGWLPPMSFELIAKDGKTPIYGALWLPRNFNPSQKYPIIDHSYTGPHTQMFPKDFRTILSRNNQTLAELGFIVIQVDGLGTYGRSKSFHDVSYRNMGKNLEDHVLAIKHLAKQYSWIDSTRVGIFGHSAGGYDAAHALLEFPDFYKVAVSSSADHDFRMEKAWWPEMYMGWPVDSLYDQVSNITMAGNLKGKLLLVHGSMDDNVNASATFKLSEALVKAGNEFDLLIMPSQRHGYTGPYRDYFIKKRLNYFIEHLLEEEPIWDYDRQTKKN